MTNGTHKGWTLDEFSRKIGNTSYDGGDTVDNFRLLTEFVPAGDAKHEVQTTK